MKSVPNLPNSDDDRRQEGRRKGLDDRRFERHRSGVIWVVLLALMLGVVLGFFAGVAI